MKGSGLADAVLPRFRSGPEVWRWNAASVLGAEMRAAVDELRARCASEDPAEFLDVVQRAVSAAADVIASTDDTSGAMGEAMRVLLDLHVLAAREAQPPAAELVRWLIAFQFESPADFFEIDPVAYAAVLGHRGMALYRSELAEIETALPPERSDDAPPWYLLRQTDPEAWERESSARRARYRLEHNARRLSVLDRDVDAIIAAHARDGRSAVWLEQTARALEEIGRFDLAIEWAAAAAQHDLGLQSERAADYWSALLGEHRPEALPAARLDVFRRWPTARRATKLQAAADDWAALEPDVLETLRSVPDEAVLFALSTDPREALELYDELGVREREVTEQLAAALETIDVSRALPLHRDLVEADLVSADSRVYGRVAARLVRMRQLAEGTVLAARVDAFIAELRTTYSRRTSLRAEFDRARLP